MENLQVVIPLTMEAKDVSESHTVDAYYYYFYERIYVMCVIWYSIIIE